jgi:hypothetical protein
LIVHAPESLRVNPASATGLRAIAFSEAYQALQSTRDNRFPATRPTLAFAFADQAAQLDLSAERRKSQVTARQRMLVRIDSGVVQYEAKIFFDILYSGVKSLRIDVPAEIAAEIQNTSSGLRESPIDPPPADLAEGDVAWSLSGETELIGTQTVTLSWERKLDQLDVGKSLQLSVPRLKPMGTDRAWGQIVLAKTESLDVVPMGEPTGLRPIDPVQDIMPDAGVRDAARAFEFHDDWSLKLTATRYQLEEVKRTSIERGWVRTVITRSDECGVQALYRLRSARQRLALKLPEGAQFDAQPARINGQPVALERGDQGQLFVPLIGQDPNTPFASSGPWTEEFSWSARGVFKWLPQAVKTDEELAAWVREGVNVNASPAFQTDGIMYLFSALRPEAPPTGDLKLWAVDERWLAVLIFAPLLIIGLLLMTNSLSTKILAIAAVVIGVVASGIFAPTFARQLLNQPMYASLAIVAVAWSAWYLSLAVRRVDQRLRPPHKERILTALAQQVATDLPPQSSRAEGDDQNG